VSTVAIIGAGYVGVPLAHVFADAGHSVLLVDVVQERVDELNRGESYIEDVPSEVLKQHVDEGRDGIGGRLPGGRCAGCDQQTAGPAVGVWRRRRFDGAETWKFIDE